MKGRHNEFSVEIRMKMRIEEADDNTDIWLEPATSDKRYNSLSFLCTKFFK